MCVACQLFSISFDSLTNISQQFGLCKHFQQKYSNKC